MGRHFVTLYALIVVTLAAVSWGQDQLIRVYDQRGAIADEEATHGALLATVSTQLRDIAPAERSQWIANLAHDSDVDIELFDLQDIAGAETLARLAAGRRAVMDAANGQIWILQKLADADQVLAFKYAPPAAGRTALEWTLVIVFYAAIALVLMLWLWPLTRDLRQLERSTTTFGDRNWRFESGIGPRSQVYPLAQAFRRMAARIDGLITSHKDMSNAMSHEIKTPLARMRFEIEMARSANDSRKLGEHLDNLNRDIDELNAFVSATLEYAILERAEVALNVAEHDFTHILPAVAESVRRAALTDIDIASDVAADATRVKCDAHLLETVVRNLLHNAVRYARSRIELSFTTEGGEHILRVDDDGPGIPSADRARVFESFVQLDRGSAPKSGFGLGLAIVKRTIEWHGGRVGVDASGLGGARFEVRWPAA
jgi:two-component system OmpR family sensor kinase